MFYAIVNGEIQNVNCNLNPNPDISGIGVRTAFYLQAILTFALNTDNSSSKPIDILITNLTLQVAGIALIISAYADSTIDIPHSVIVNYFVVMLSACRNTSFNFSAAFLGDRRGEKTVLLMWIVDLVFRPLMLVYNFSVWNAMRRVQVDGLCSGGDERILFFGDFNASVASMACEVGWTFCLLDIVWEILRYVGEITRMVVRKRLALTGQAVYDSRIWWALYLVTLGRTPAWDQTCQWTSVISRVHSVVTWVFVCISVECMVLLNGYGRAENAWGFGQTFAMADTLVLVILICLRPHLRGTAHVDPVPWLTRRTYSFIPAPGTLYRPRHRVAMVCVGPFWILCI
jgi:hypothetical protein